MTDQDYERLAQLSAKRPDEAAYADAVARQNYDIAAGAAGTRCLRCRWAPTLDQIRESLSGTGSLYYQGMEATRRLLADHQCPGRDRAQELAPLTPLFQSIAGWMTAGDENCGVSLICPRCRERDIDSPWIPVPADGFGYLANLVITALEHKCPEPEPIQVPDAPEIQCMASLIGYLDPAAGRAIFDHAAELADRLQQVHRDGFSR